LKLQDLAAIDPGAGKNLASGTMTDPSTLPPARLFTTWGTVLYVDAVSEQLRHGTIETSPANAVFVADATSTRERRQGWMMHASGEALDPIACGALSCRSFSTINGGDPPPLPTVLELVPLERGLIAFRAGGVFLCAQPDGRLNLANPVCSTWECFLASEDWCSTIPAAGNEHPAQFAGPAFDKRRIAGFIIDAQLRAKANTASRATKILIYGYPQWSHGRLFYDLCKNLHQRGYIVDIINWQVNHAEHMHHFLAYYDLFISALDGVRTLIDVYGVPCEKVIALSQHEMDIRILIEQKGKDIFREFAGYGVVSYQLFDASVLFGIPRHPLVVQHGVAFDEFYTEIPERLETVGYAGSYSHKTLDGLEWKRGDIAEAAAREAGLEFRVAGSTANQISFHDMPEFYKSVDAILVSSITEGAQLPVKEGAAAGRLVISTPVGDFPLRAYQGVGIVAPIESHKYKKFVTATLKYFKENPAAFAEICRKTQDAARQLDWSNMIDDWVELIESAKDYVLAQAHSHQQEAAGLFEDDKEEGFLRAALQAIRLRPQSAEPLQDLVSYYLEAHRAGSSAMQVSVFDQVNLEREFGFIKEKGLSRHTDLCHQMLLFGSDKSGPFHNYTVLYDSLFSRFRNEELAVFELGLGTDKVGAPSSMGREGKPGASLRGWRAYFPRALIYGADIDADILFQEDRIRTFWTDQREPRAIRALWNKLDDVVFDIIVDDGLHEAAANICFLMESIGRLKPGGIYVIEDVTPNDAELVGNFAHCIAPVAKSIVFEELDHPVNKVDNRLLIFQKA
jgi:glycosyltransferase involved in cell wall biosynthesis